MDGIRGFLAPPESENMEIQYLRFLPHSKHYAALRLYMSVAFAALIDRLECFLPEFGHNKWDICSGSGF